MNTCTTECAFTESDLVVPWSKFHRREIVDNKFFIIFGITKPPNTSKCQPMHTSFFQHSSVKTSCKVNGLRQYKCITLCLNKSKMDLCKECFKVYKFHFMDYGFFFQDKLLPFSCKCTNRMFLSLLALTRDIALSFFL